MNKLAELASSRLVSGGTFGLLWIAAYNDFEKAYLTSSQGRFAFAVVYVVFAVAAFIRLLSDSAVEEKPAE